MSKGLAVSLVLLFATCKKESAGTGRAQTILGTWNFEAFGTDSNKNRILELSERNVFEPGRSSTLTFLDGGEAVNHFQKNSNVPLEVDSDKQWRLRDNDKFLDLVLNLFSAT